MSFVFKCLFFPLFQSDNEQEDEGNCRARAQFRQLQPPIAQETTRRAQQFGRALPEWKQVRS